MGFGNTDSNSDRGAVGHSATCGGHQGRGGFYGLDCCADRGPG